MGIEDKLEPLIASLARSFGHDGRAIEVAILASSKATINQSSYDNWDGGTYGYSVTFEVPAHLYSQIKTDIEKLEKELLEMARQLVRHYANEGIDNIFLTTELSALAPDWRERAKGWVTGRGVTNQGRVRSDNVAARECDGLLFRSQPEINLYKALKGAGVSFSPLPVFIRGGDSYRRIEPDFIILKGGTILTILHVEVDGDTVHVETPLDAHNRTKMMMHEGAVLERIRADDCDNFEKAELVVEKLLAVIAKHKANRL